MMALILVVAIGATYFVGNFLAIRREHGIVTLSSLSKHRNIDPITLVREIRATSGRNLAHFDRILLTIAYLLIAGILLLATYGACLRLVR